MQIGYIGVGNMGGALARRLQLSQPIHVFDLDRKVVDRMVAAGATACGGVGEIAEQCDVVFTCLQTSTQVRSVIFGQDGLASNLKPGAMVVDQTTGDAIATKAMAQELAAKGIAMVDAPVSGGPQWAEAGTIAIMVGASEADFPRIEPLLRQISANVVHCGEVGTGMVSKVCNNLLAASQRLLTFEVVALAVKNGLTPDKAVEVMTKGSGTQLHARCHLPAPYPAGRIVPGFYPGADAQGRHFGQRTRQRLGSPAVHRQPGRQLYQMIVNDLGSEEEVNCAVRSL